MNWPISWNDINEHLTNTRSIIENDILEDYKATITWDGNTNGRIVVRKEGYPDSGWCRISALLPNRETISDITWKGINNKKGEITEGTIEDTIPLFENDDVWYGLFAVFVYKDDYYLEVNDITFPKAGIYFSFNALGGDEYLTELTFDTIGIKQNLLRDTESKITTFDLNSYGIDVESLLMSGGGSATIDASEIFRSLRPDQSIMLCGKFQGDTMYVAPTFYNWSPDGSLVSLGFGLCGNIGTGYALVNYVMFDTSLHCIITPLSA